MRLLFIVLAVVSQIAGCSTQEQETAASMGFPQPFQSWRARRFSHVVRQQTDFTCGAASLAIISRYYLERPISEAQFAKSVRDRYTDSAWHENEKERNGLSLLDMKLAAEHFGFKAEGVKMTIEDASTLRGPIIIHLDKGFNQHFAVLRGIVGDRAYLSDPILGNVRVPVYRFQQEWTGYALAIWIENEDLPADHKLTIRSTDMANQVTAARRSLYVVQPPPIPYRF